MLVGVDPITGGGFAFVGEREKGEGPRCRDGGRGGRRVEEDGVLGREEGAVAVEDETGMVSAERCEEQAAGVAREMPAAAVGQHVGREVAKVGAEDVEFDTTKGSQIEVGVPNDDTGAQEAAEGEGGLGLQMIRIVRSSSVGVLSRRSSSGASHL